MRLAPVGIEEVEEVPDHGSAIEPSGQAVGLQAQPGAISDKQQVPARERIPASHALQQQWVALRTQPMQGQQIDVSRQFARVGLSGLQGLLRAA